MAPDRKAVPVKGQLHEHSSKIVNSSDRPEVLDWVRDQSGGKFDGRSYCVDSLQILLPRKRLVLLNRQWFDVASLTIGCRACGSTVVEMIAIPPRHRAGPAINTQRDAVSSPFVAGEEPRYERVDNKGQNDRRNPEPPVSSGHHDFFGYLDTVSAALICVR